MESKVSKPYQVTYKAPRTPTVTTMTASARAKLEARWKVATEDPSTWLLQQVVDAAKATNRAGDDVLRQWGLNRP